MLLQTPMALNYKHSLVALIAVILTGLSLAHYGYCSCAPSTCYHDPSALVAEIALETPYSDGQCVSSAASAGTTQISFAIPAVPPGSTHRFSPLPRLCKVVPSSWEAYFPALRIISVLHKKNAWHQSSEDEPHLTIPPLL